MQEHLQDHNVARGLTKQACDSILSFVQNARQTGSATDAQDLMSQDLMSPVLLTRAFLECVLMA